MTPNNCSHSSNSDPQICALMWTGVLLMIAWYCSNNIFPQAGLSAPVPRGRKGKKLKNQLSVPEMKHADWLVNCNPEVVLQDDSYKKHLKQHCNK